MLLKQRHLRNRRPAVDHHAVRHRRQRTLNGQRFNIDRDQFQAGLLHDPDHRIHDLFRHGDQQNPDFHLGRSGTDDPEVKIQIIRRKRHILLQIPANGLAHFLFRHPRKIHFPDEQIPATQRGGHPTAGKAVFRRQLLQGIREQFLLRNRAILNGPLRRLHQRHPFQIRLAASQNHIRHFDGPAADIQTDGVFPPTGDFSQ